MKTDLVDEAKRLSVTDRIELVEAIWDTVAEDASLGDIPLTQAQQAELDRRIEDWRRDPDSGSSWSEVKARLEQDR